MIFELFCYAAAVVCFGLAALNIPANKINLIGLGLAFAFLPPLIAALPALG